MKITVHEAKVRHELEAEGRRCRDSMQLCQSEVDVLVSKLYGGTQEEIGKRIGKSPHSVANLIAKIRLALSVRDDVELAYLAYERGWVVID